MERGERTRELLITHYQTYPELQIQDIFKYLYQSSYGCDHMVTSLDASIEDIRREFTDNNVLQNNETLIDILDGAYSRVHLAYLGRGMSAETLGKLFFASAQSEHVNKLELEYKLSVAKELARENLFHFSSRELEETIEEWKYKGYPAIHHSNTFRTRYHPAYRVIAKKYVSFLPLFSKLDEMLDKGTVILAVEGGSASGKTTLSEILTNLYDCSVFHMDDFFLRPEQRTPERYAEVGGNIDRERFLEEVLTPLCKGKFINYRRFDCSTMKFKEPIRITPKKLIVIEGAYSMHPEFTEYYNLSVFLDVSPKLQKERILKRNDLHEAKKFFEEWIPLETVYFSETKAPKRCNIHIPIIE